MNERRATNAKVKISKDALSIVIIGDFNPPIFHPEWFKYNELVGDVSSGFENASIITREVSQFSLGSFSIQCTVDRLQVEAQSAIHGIDLRDLVANIFAILAHVPVAALGFNSHKVVKMPSNESWHKFGNDCVPKKRWNQIMNKPGMRGLTIEGKRLNSSAKYTQVKAEPVRGTEDQIHVRFNEHYQIDEDDNLSPQDRMQSLLAILQKDFLPFQAYTKTSTETIFDPYFQGKGSL